MNIIKYDNDITLIHDEMKGISTVAIGIYVRCGSLFEEDKTAGISHVIEHMMYKGTKSMNNFKLNELFDLYSVSFNAFTSRDITAYYAVSSKKYVNKIAALLSDMFFNATFPKEELELEKNVILSEYQASETDDTDIATDNIDKIAFESSRRAIPIIGTKENIKSFTSEDLFEYKDKMYTTSNIVVVITGKISKQNAENVVKTYFLNKAKNGSVNNYEKVKKLDNFSTDKYVERIKDSEQSTVILSYDTNETLKMREKQLYALSDVIFSQGMSSRLFKEVREKHGLVYGISAYKAGAREENKVYIEFSCDNSNMIKTLKIIKREIEKLRLKGISRKEFNSSKIRYINLFQAAMDSSIARNRGYAKSYLVDESEVDFDSISKEVDSITFDELNDFAKNEYIKGSPKISFVGKKSDDFTIEKLYEIVR